MKQKEHDGIRPLVAKYHEQFQGHVRQYGRNVVKQVLLNGRHGNVKLKAPFNRKDRHQMLVVLGLIEEK